ncbi:MAG: hypothetical protein Q8Q41_00685 [bacterium]|nr:hypothetical protein [bacterium]
MRAVVQELRHQEADKLMARIYPGTSSPLPKGFEIITASEQLHTR